MLSQLGLQLPLVPVRQTVGYWKVEGDPEMYHHPQCPVWVHLGETAMHYGLPAFPGQPGIKAALHQTSAEGSDPDQEGRVEEWLLQESEQFLRSQLQRPLGERLGAETCFYTNTPTEDFVLAHHPSDSRIVIGAGFSGHGFKLGPLTGRILAELLDAGTTTVPAFEADRARFGLR
jgi:glycine/D-amino acid oxidase-like deaminating enzyme